ncbi:MAG: acid phosphatase [Hyphomonas sp.]|uniref:HAD family acid phosphatase n=1 Tax=Hyphomonas sp. TaxID=87 RepID=UPI001837F802|nr:HAD family acid phosphatase [Hyphomonas sp.]MBA3068313.1 acid phosphatase [Hyphomonas sp.]MBU3921613.1 acid phosphatase [Alphaproteobacteria bacterium]MBU4060821.1 acid phosphatase [Alphaproteobacteria bacterium]MBU4164805.1 acid phosphatase [Alphaproteobacteria bacterium]
MKRYLLPSLFALLAACQTAPVPAPAAPVAAETSAPPVAAPTPGQQWLYGSAEGRIALVQGWNAVAAYVESRAAARPNASVVLAPGASAEAAEFLPCGDKPLAAVFDADETLIWNLGVTAATQRMGKAFDPKVWNDWEQTGAGKAVAIPGALDALARIRAAGVEVIVNTNRSAGNAEGNAATLSAAGTGNFVHGSTLFLRGDDDQGSGKDGRRATISETYCVVALVGDQLGDIADLFNAKSLTPPERKALTTSAAFDPMWGNGWFILANPAYGPSIAGTMVEVFPASTYWEPASPE